MKIIADLSKAEPLGVKDKQGKVWCVPAAEERNTVQSIAFQRYAEASIAVTKAVKTNHERLDDFVGNSGVLAVQLVCCLLVDEEGINPTIDEATEMSRGGMLNHIMQFYADERNDGKEEVEASPQRTIDSFDLDGYAEGIDRPTGEETGST